jgi:putative two-component system response regulator
MAHLAEARDSVTGKHMARVSRYCELAAEALRGLDPRFEEEIEPSFVEDIGRAAPLHDVGKVGIPDSILLKPGPLDEEEWAVMRTHPQIGADLVQRVIERTEDPGSLPMGYDIALCHHERWDGSGYPQGLAGEDIPLSARILAVADCFDALTSRRPYKEAWTHEAAADYLRDHAGTQFDPSVVEAFLTREDEADEIRRRLSDEAPR